ncbi:MAG: hypothetical protein CMQ05_14105 [Gammaproteobacteria bacterium]|nr:hypothetical protein [Gammaproteobacteria bacterium]
MAPDTDTDPSPEADPTAPLAFTNVTAASGIGYEVGFLSPEDLDAVFPAIPTSGAAPNTEAAGARVIVTTASNKQLQEIIIGSNFLSQNPTEQVFGLGTDSLANFTVAWSDGSEFSLTDVASRQTLVIVQ